MLVIGFDRTHPGAVRRLEDIVEAVRCRLVGAHQAKVPLAVAEPHHVAQEGAHHAGGLSQSCAGFGDGQRIVPIVGEAKLAPEKPAIDVGIGAHATRAVWR
jgi:hypothetical protein